MWSRFFCSLILMILIVPASANEVVAQSNNERAIHAMVKNWAQAWQNQAVDEYLNFYSPDFVPANGLTLAQWQKQRTERVSEPLFIKTITSDINVTELRGAFAEVQFQQKYTAARYQDQVMKTLQLERVGGKWLILKESSKPIKNK
jgi:murein L,D-transpeptidase YafK